MSRKIDISPLSVRENTLWNAVGCFFYLGCQWLITVVVVLISHNYSYSGALAFSMALGNMFSSIGLYKIRTFQVSDITNRYSSGDYISFRFVTIAIGIIGALVYLVASTGNLSFISASIVYLLFKADETFNDVLFGIDQKNARMDFIGKSQMLRGIATLAGFIIPLCLFDNLELAILGMGLLCISVTLFYDLRHSRLFGDLSPQYNKTKIVGLAKECLMPTLASLCATSIVSLARQIYGISQGEELLGIYASIATPAVLIQAAATYLYSPLIGSLASKLYTQGNREFKKSFIKVLGMMVAVIAVLIAVLGISGGRALVMLYGSEIEPYIGIFPYVLIATGTIGLLLYVNDALIIIRANASQLVFNGLALFFASISLIPFESIVGMGSINYSIILGASIGIVTGTVFILISKPRQ